MKRKLATLQILLVACIPLSSLQTCASFGVGLSYTDPDEKTYSGTFTYTPLPKAPKGGGK